ncbi:hypothetical protein N1I81_22785 [Bacillus sp. FSL M8-0052]|uniref:hypothetical protein n=1 Tax=Bacillus sp. FSL M8-0052 TaxID=2978203 RepID=UPI0030FB293D
MSLLNKIKNVTINNTHRISVADKEYCEHQYMQYLNAQNALDGAIALIKPVCEQQRRESRPFISKYKDLNHLEDRCLEVKKEFIYNITYYFSNKYNVTLNSNSIDQKYDKNLTYMDIVAEIFEQLGGYSFEEKAVSEIMEASRNTIYNFERVTIKKASLTITHFVSWDTWYGDYRLHWNNEKLETLFKALSHFENGSTETLDLLNQMKQQLNEGEKEYNIFSKYEFKFQKIKSMRVYKNGKITIEFNSNEQANEFANTYLKK